MDTHSTQPDQSRIARMFHNRSAEQIAEMAFDAQQRMRSAEADYEACRDKLIALANGARFAVTVPNLCRVTITPPPRDNGKRVYSIYSEAFERLGPDLQRMLLEAQVVKERKKPQSPVMRILPP